MLPLLPVCLEVLRKENWCCESAGEGVVVTGSGTGPFVLDFDPLPTLLSVEHAEKAPPKSS